MRLGERRFALRFRAVCVAVLTGLAASLVLFTDPSPICVGVIPVNDEPFPFVESLLLNIPQSTEERIPLRREDAVTTHVIPAQGTAEAFVAVVAFPLSDPLNVVEVTPANVGLLAIVSPAISA